MTNFQSKLYNKYDFVPKMLSGMAGVGIGLIIANYLQWI